MRLVKHKFPCSIGNSKKLKNAVRGSTALKIMLIFAFITFSLTAAATVASAASVGTVSISSDEIILGESAQVEISILNSVNVTGMNIVLTYDSSIISLDSVSSDYTVTNDDAEGTLTIELRELNYLTNTGSVPVIDLTFNAVAGGSSSLSFQDVEILEDENVSPPSATSEGVITVTSTDTAPVLDSIGDQFVDEGDTLKFTISATDAEDDDITYSTTGLPSGAYFNSDKGDFRWTPGAGTAGDYNVEFIATANDLTDSETITITVSGPDQAPVLSGIGNKEGVVKHALSFPVHAEDPDGDDVTYSLGIYPDGATIGSTSGIFSWTPSLTGNFYVNFIATANGVTSSEQIKITVTEDSAPVLASIGSKNGNEGELLSFTISATDPNGDDITYSANNLPGGASIDSTTGAFRWTPDYDAEGTYNVDFIASSYGLTDSESITITIDNVDRPPVLDSIGNKAVSENEFLSFNISANDPDGDTAITYSARNLPEGATFNPGTATFSWTPGYNDSDNYDVEFIANSNGLTDSETITITVGDYNRPPELSSIGSKSVKEGDKLTITLSATDYDSDDLTYSVQNMPDNATFNTTGKFIWTPESGDAGTYHVLFSVSDGTTDNSENVTITVTVPSSSSGGGGSSGSSSSSSSSGGGGALTSAEEYDNIALKDYALKMSVLKDEETVFTFGKVGNSIDSVSFTPNVNGGQAKVVVEMLQSTSSQVGSVAPGDVYKNMNILLDTSLVPAAIKKINIVFKVEKSWVNASDINVSNIVLCRYSGGEWGQLATEMKEDDADYFYFKSETPGFSSFAISSIDTSLASTLSPTANTVSIPQLEDSLMSTADSAQMELDLEASPKSTSAFGFVVVLILAGIGIIYWAVRLE